MTRKAVWLREAGLFIILSIPLAIFSHTLKNLGKSFVGILKIYYGLGEKIIDSVKIEGIENFNKAKSN